MTTSTIPSEYDKLTLAYVLDIVWAIAIRRYKFIETDTRLQLSLQNINLGKGETNNQSPESGDEANFAYLI